ncbi:hypothetical protein JOM56_000618 [Amanita muscaria]
MVRSVAFSPDGKRIASGSADQTIYIWDAETGLQVGNPLQGHTDCVTSVAFSHDGKRIASGSEDKTIYIWDAETGLQVGNPLQGHTHWVTSVAFSPDGKRIASGSDDKAIYIWDAETGLQVGNPLQGHTDRVTSVAFSHDGKRIASGSRDETIYIWDAETGLQVGNPLQGHTNFVTSVAFSHDGKRIASGSLDKAIYIWDAETEVQILSDAHSGKLDHGPISRSQVIKFSPAEEHALCEPFGLFHGAKELYQDWREHVVLDPHGWVFGPQGRLLVWIPETHRKCLLLPKVLVTIPSEKSLSCNMSMYSGRYSLFVNDIDIDDSDAVAEAMDYDAQIEYLLNNPPDSPAPAPVTPITVSDTATVPTHTFPAQMEQTMVHLVDVFHKTSSDADKAQAFYAIVTEIAATLESTTHFAAVMTRIADNLAIMGFAPQTSVQPCTLPHDPVTVTVTKEVHPTMCLDETKKLRKEISDLKSIIGNMKKEAFNVKPCPISHEPCTLPHATPCTLPHANPEPCTLEHATPCIFPHIAPCALPHTIAVPIPCPLSHNDPCSKEHTTDEENLRRCEATALTITNLTESLRKAEVKCIPISENLNRERDDHKHTKQSLNRQIIFLTMENTRLKKKVVPKKRNASKVPILGANEIRPYDTDRYFYSDVEDSVKVLYPSIPPSPSPISTQMDIDIKDDLVLPPPPLVSFPKRDFLTREDNKPFQICDNRAMSAPIAHTQQCQPAPLRAQTAPPSTSRNTLTAQRCTSTTSYHHLPHSDMPQKSVERASSASYGQFSGLIVDPMEDTTSSSSSVTPTATTSFHAAMTSTPLPETETTHLYTSKCLRDVFNKKAPDFHRAQALYQVFIEIASELETTSHFKAVMTRIAENLAELDCKAKPCTLHCDKDAVEDFMNEDSIDDNSLLLDKEIEEIDRELDAYTNPPIAKPRTQSSTSAIPSSVGLLAPLTVVPPSVLPSASLDPPSFMPKVALPRAQMEPLPLNPDKTLIPP